MLHSSYLLFGVTYAGCPWTVWSRFVDWFLGSWCTYFTLWSPRRMFSKKNVFPSIWLYVPLVQPFINRTLLKLLKWNFLHVFMKAVTCWWANLKAYLIIFETFREPLRVYVISCNWVEKWKYLCTKLLLYILPRNNWHIHIRSGNSQKFFCPSVRL